MSRTPLGLSILEISLIALLSPLGLLPRFHARAFFGSYMFNSRNRKIDRFSNHSSDRMNFHLPLFVVGM